jgi:hypothetical protein
MAEWLKNREQNTYSNNAKPNNENDLLVNQYRMLKHPWNLSHKVLRMSLLPEETISDDYVRPPDDTVISYTKDEKAINTLIEHCLQRCFRGTRRDAGAYKVLLYPQIGRSCTAFSNSVLGVIYSVQNAQCKNLLLLLSSYNSISFSSAYWKSTNNL